jgi:hypothetical protein
MTCAATHTNPIDRILSIAERLRAAGDYEDADWIKTAVMRHIKKNESLDRGLGLVGTLGRSPRFDYMRRERNGHLAEALDCLGGDYARLAEEIICFESRFLTAWKHRADAPHDWSPTRTAIHRAFRVGMSNVPATAGGLQKALSETN